jgi:hypothetical protein
MADLVLGVPPSIAAIVQTGLIERGFHDALYPSLLFRSEAISEKWEGNTGVEIFETRAGLIAPATTPLTPGVDPTPASLTWEQWAARILQYGLSINTNMPTSATAAASLFLRHIQQLGLNAGQTMNRLPRNALYSSYLGGSTVLLAAATAADTTIHVSALNGFTDVVIPTGDVRPVAVSASKPLSITITDGTNTEVRNVVGFTQDDPNDPLGPGFLTLSAGLTNSYAARSSVLSSARPVILRSGGGNSIDAIGAADSATLQDFINGVNQLRAFNVQPHEDGYFHAHIDPKVNGQLFADPVFQRLNQSLPEHVIYKEGFIGTISGILFYMNTETPNRLNSGALTATSSSAQYSADIGSESVNGAGLDIARSIVTGKGALMEKYLDESAYITEAGTTGKIGEFSIVNNSLQVVLDRIRLIIRSPLDALQNTVTSSWTSTTCFPVPTDITASGPQRFKRGVVIESVLA